MNDAHGAWGEPSTDFLTINDEGRLVAIELTRDLVGIRPCWRALCQVTHRAVTVARSAASSKTTRRMNDEGTPRGTQISASLELRPVGCGVWLQLRR